MVPAIQSGSILFVNKISYGFRAPFCGLYLMRWAKPKPGDVVVFWTPYGDLAVKRCAGLEGENSFLAYGDNSSASFDSRFYGSVPLDNIVGKAAGIKPAASSLEAPFTGPAPGGFDK